MRLEELVRTLEAEVHRLREENARLEQLEDENEELLQEVWAHRERLIEEVKESDTTILRTSEERRTWLHGLFDEALRETLAEEIERRESAEAENSRLVEELRVVREALKAAHHDLTLLNGLYATDRPDLIPEPLAIHIDATSAMKAIDAALSQSEAPEGEENNRA